MDTETTNPVVRIARGALALATVAIVLAAFAWVLTRPWRSQQSLKPGQIALRVLHWGDKSEDSIVRDLIESFEKQNPDVKVIRSNVGSPAQLATKLQTMLASGDPPDLFYLPFEKVAAIASNNVLEDVEPFVKRDVAAGVKDAPDLADYFPATLNAFRYDPSTRSVGRGTLVGLPKDFTGVGFYYNKSLFDRAGAAYPPKDGWTWDQFIDTAAGDKTAFHDDPNSITDHLHVMQNVRAEKDGLPAIAQAQNQIAHLLASDRVQTGHRLIEDDQFRVVNQRLCQADTLQHPFGELAQLPGTRFRQSDEPQEVCDPLVDGGAIQSCQLAIKPKKLLGGEIVIEIG